MQSRMLPCICESTVGVAMGKVKHSLPHFTTHDFGAPRAPTSLRLASIRMWPSAA